MERAGSVHDAAFVIFSQQALLPSGEHGHDFLTVSSYRKEQK